MNPQVNFKTHQLLLFFLVLLSPLTGLTQGFNKQKLDSLMTRLEEKDKIMGSLSLYKDGVEIYSRAIGFADIATKTKASPQTKYRIGSITKTFTAAIILQMVDENKLTLDTKLEKFFPSITNANKITIEHLLRHRSGIYNITNSEDYPTWMLQPITQAMMVEKIRLKGVTAEPDSRFEYSNSGYMLLSFIAEKIDGKAYAEIVQTRIVKPLKLVNTAIGGKIDIKKNEANSYTYNGSWSNATETDMSIPSGAGAVISTARDVNTFYINLMDGKVISAKSLSLMTTLVDNSGMGIFQFPFHLRKAWGHTGGIDGFSTSSGYFNDEKLAITFLSNAQGIGVNEVMIGVLSIYFGLPYQIPVFNPGPVFAPEELDVFTGTYGSPTFPLKIMITRNGSVLTGQATGQPAFPLEATSKTEFRFSPAGLTMQFKADEKLMVFQQGGRTFELKKE